MVGVSLGANFVLIQRTLEPSAYHEGCLLSSNGAAVQLHHGLARGAMERAL